jgi:hypothetical protein
MRTIMAHGIMASWLSGSCWYATGSSAAGASLQEPGWESSGPGRSDSGEDRDEDRGRGPVQEGRPRLTILNGGGSGRSCVACPDRPPSR